MAAPALTIVELAESERTVLLRANIAEGGDADLSNLVLANIADYAAVGPEAVALSINRVWWSLENMNVELKFEADTPVKALTLSGNGSYDFSSISGVKNPGGSGSTGSILLDTYGIAINTAKGCVGSLVIELWKVRSGEAGGELDSAATSSLFTPEVPEVSGGIIIGGNDAASGYIRLLEDTDNGTNYIDIKAPASIPSNVTLTLPTTDGDASQFLQTNGSGVLTWATPTGGVPFTAATTTVGSSIDLVEGTDNGTNKITIKAPASLAGDVVLTLPVDDGSSGQFLKTDGSGVLSWATASGSGAEEGTWTPQFSIDGTNLTATYSGRYGYYIKTGNMVIVSCGMHTTALTNPGSGSQGQISGLPFAPSENYGSANVGFAQDWAANTPLHAATLTTSKIVLYYRSAVGSTDGNITYSAFSTGSDNNYISVYAIYHTA